MTSNNLKTHHLTTSRRKKILRVVATVVMVVYTLITLFPFYVLIIRSFVPTKESADLHLWIPETEELSLDAQVGNLGVYYDLDTKDLKDALGIPQTDFIMARTTLRELGEKYDIPESDIQDFFKGFYTYNGWKTLLTSDLYGTSFWGVLLRTLAVTFTSLTLLTILSIFTGFGLAGLERKYQMSVYNIYLLQMVVPAMLILLPQYQLFQWIFKLVPGFEDNTTIRYICQLAAIIVINIKGTALSVMIFTSAISSIPKEFEEAAFIDGASRWQYLWKILLPLLKVPIVSLIVIELPYYYNLFLEPYVYLDPGNSTLLPFISNAIGQFSTNFQVIYSAIFASMAPIVLVYLIFRRYFVQGALAGAIKG
ncbi:MAG: carbohydrate ABC transporter permease [Anaerolineales bacterium]|nr:carbohydrate ABC transporter permease [Anaerolineales bacterium]